MPRTSGCAILLDTRTRLTAIRQRTPPASAISGFWFPRISVEIARAHLCNRSDGDRWRLLGVRQASSRALPGEERRPSLRTARAITALGWGRTGSHDHDPTQRERIQVMVELSSEMTDEIQDILQVPIST